MQQDKLTLSDIKTELHLLEQNSINDCRMIEIEFRESINKFHQRAEMERLSHDAIIKGNKEEARFLGNMAKKLHNEMKAGDAKANSIEKAVGRRTK
jgi:hypothetical protein